MKKSWWSGERNGNKTERKMRSRLKEVVKAGKKKGRLRIRDGLSMNEALVAPLRTKHSTGR